ncbi:MAG: TIGR03617 family F420-dependent LLM class oxidoreductase [Hyphomicrobiaceae bacterium]
MRIYSELILGKTDPGLRAPDKAYDLGKARDHAAIIEDLGFDALVATETKNDPFVLLSLAASATSRVQLLSGVAIAFPRSPAVTAMAAWDIQRLSKGRLILGLGTQVRAHLVRRFGLGSHPIGPWMRDYVGALRAIWNCWQTGTKLDYQSERYKLDLMVPLFNPGPLDTPPPPVHVAAVNEYMCRVAGEVADGLRPHPMCTPRYIKEVMLPAAAKGAERTGRSTSDLEVGLKPLVATGPNEETLVRRIADVRARVAFYASTPGYRPCFEIWGYGDLCRHLSTLARDQKWDEMPSLIDDEMLNTFAIVGDYNTVAEKIVDRFADVLDSVGFSIEVNSPQDAETLKGMVRKIQAG